MPLSENKENLLRKKIREQITNTLNEMTTTGNVAGYLTPGAFVGDKHGNGDSIRKMAKSIGYTLTAKGVEDTRPGDTLRKESVTRMEKIRADIVSLTENYYEYRNDPTSKPHQKIGRAISEMNKQLKLVERALRMNSKLKLEAGVPTDQLWKRTTKQIAKLEQKFVELSGKLRELRN